MSDSSSRWGERLVFATAKPAFVAPAHAHDVVRYACGAVVVDIDADTRMEE